MPFVTSAADRVQSIKIEYNLVDGCNYSCRECSHFSPFMAHKSADLGAFDADLRALEAAYHVRRFRFVGGEPLLHKQLLDFVRAVRSSGIADTIEIVTNGSLLDHADDAVFREVDSLSISWYRDRRFDQAKLDRATDRCRRFGTQLKVRKIDEFRMMQLDEPITDDRLLHQVFDSCQIAHTWYCQTFYEGRFYLCSRPIFTEGYLGQKRTGAGSFRDADGIGLHEPELFPRLMRYLTRTEPLASCSFCLGTVGKKVQWGQMPPDERKSTAPLARRAEASISGGVLRYLLGWARLERAVLRVAPSLRISRALHLCKEALLRA